MATRSNRIVPARAIHPGEILREELQERGIKQKDFAQAIGIQATHLNEFIKGKRNLNEDLAMKLESQLGIPFNIWMNLWMKRGRLNSTLYNLKRHVPKFSTSKPCINDWALRYCLARKG